MRLTPEQRQQFIQMSQSQYEGIAAQVGEINKRYSGIATQYGLDPSRIVVIPKTYGEEETGEPGTNEPAESEAAAPASGADADLPVIDSKDMKAYDALKPGAKYKLPGDDFVYTKGQ